jgi:Flp pilus assembly protein TadD
MGGNEEPLNTHPQFRDPSCGGLLMIATRSRGIISMLLLCFTTTFAALADSKTNVGVELQNDDTTETARQLIAKGRFKEAEVDLRTASPSHSASAEWHFLLAYALLREDKATESLAEYTLAAQLRTPSAEDLKNVALDYVLLNDYVSADKWVSQSLKWNDRNGESWYVLGRIRYSSGNLPSAVECFQHALTLAPGSVKAENNLGLAYEGLNRPEDAIAAYRTAVSWQQNVPHPSAQPLLNLAIALSHEQRLDDALPLLAQAVAIAPTDPKIHQQLGQLYLRLGRLSDAQNELEKAVTLAPDTAPFHFLLGRIYRQRGLETQAKVEFARVSALNGTHSTPEITAGAR